MSEFKIKGSYLGTNKKIFFKDNKPTDYHSFHLFETINNIPIEYRFKQDNPEHPSGYLFILQELAQEANLNFEVGQSYCFIIRLGEPRTAQFKVNNSNTMVLKARDYFKNTIKKIGFWTNEDFFYELDKSKKPTKKNSNNSLAEAKNKNNWEKIVLICLPIVALAFLSFAFVIIKRVGKKKKI